MSAYRAHFLTIFLLLLITSPLQAATDLIFPRVIFQKDHWIGIALANPTSAEAEVTLTAYNLDGSLFAGTGVINPAVKKIAAGSQYVNLSWQTFAAPDSLTSSPVPTRLWVEVTSATDSLTGFFLEGHDGKSGIPDYLAGSDLSGYGTDLAIPIVENVSPSVTELSAVNPNTEEATLFIDFLGADGSVISSQTTKIPPKGALQAALSDLFKITFDKVAAMRLHSDKPVHCYGSVFRLSDPSLVTIAAQNASLPAKSLQFPQLAEGGGWATSVGIQNLSKASVLISLTAYQADGTLFTAPTVKENPVTRQVNAGGLFQSSLNALFQFADGQLETGSLKVETDSSAIIGYVEYGAGTTRALVPAQTTTSKRSFFSYQYLGSPYFTGLAVLNPGSLTTNIEVFSLDSQGVPIGKAQRVLKPGQTAALVMQQWVSATTDNPKANGGAVLVRADNPTTATQLWGTQAFTALANISPQQVSGSYNPPDNLADLTVTPKLAVVETGKTRQFSQAGATDVTWSVVGGDPSLGTISAGGVYQAPGVAPSRHNITIEASTTQGDRAAGATIDVIQRESLISGLTRLTAVAYLDNLQRFFVAEQQLLSSAPLTTAAAAANTIISEVSTSGEATQYVSIPNDTIVQMIPLAYGGGTYMLLAGIDSGNIYRMRIDDGSKQLRTVYSGLNMPNSMALGPGGDLLVSESGANQIRVVPRSQIQAAGAAVQAESRALVTGMGERSIPAVAPQGIAVNPCTGALYVTLADGTLHELQGSRDSVIASGLNRPGHMQVLFRVGFSCSDGLSIAVAEVQDVVLVVPSKGLITPIIDGFGDVSDLTFLPDGNPFTPGKEASLIIADKGTLAGSSGVSVVRLGGIYQSTSPVPLPAVSNGGWAIPYPDPVGDTFATSLSTSNKLDVPDIVSVTSYSLARPTPWGFVDVPYVAILLTFSSKVAPLSANLPYSVDGTVYLNTGATGIQVDQLNNYNPYFLNSGTGVNYEVNLGREKLIDTSNMAETSIVVRYFGSFVSILLPSKIIDLSRTKAIVLAGNAVEMTDVAPDSLAIQLAP